MCPLTWRGTSFNRAGNSFWRKLKFLHLIGSVRNKIRSNQRKRFVKIAKKNSLIYSQINLLLTIRFTIILVHTFITQQFRKVWMACGFFSTHNKKLQLLKTPFGENVKKIKDKKNTFTETDALFMISRQKFLHPLIMIWVQSVLT